MASTKIKPGPGQQSFDLEGMAPEIPLPIDPMDFSGDGVSTSLIEGYRVMDRVVKEIARARSNRDGFGALPTNSQAVKEFAKQIDETPEDTKRKVVATGGLRRSGSNNLTHYERPQLRLMDYHKKQVERAKQDPRIAAIGDIALINESNPQDILGVEAKFFPVRADTKEEIIHKEKNRRRLSRIVKQHS
jgi:hypothetical protein